MPRLEANGLTFHVQVRGEGPDLVLIHGLTGDLSVWLLSGTIQELARTHRVLAFDLRGHGYSEVAPTGYTSADQAGDVFALMDALGMRSARLVGHSFGGVIAAHAAAIDPGRVEAIVFSDPYFPALRHLESMSRWGHWQNFRDEAEGAGVTLSDEYWYDLDKFFDQVVHLDDEKLRKFRRAVGLPAMNRLMKLGTTTCGPDSKAVAGLTAERIEALAIPCLALYGEASPFLATADYLVEHLANCHPVLVPGAQHRAAEENPAAFVAALVAFLGSLAPAEARR